MSNFRLSLFICVLNCTFSFANVWHIGVGFKYHNLEQAAAEAMAGDTLLFRNGTYNGNQFVSSLKGENQKNIYILAETDGEVIISGGDYSWHLPDAENIYIRGFIIENQKSNGLNIDDGGDYSRPARNISFVNCIFRNISASGNNDLLKLSGLNNFEIVNCTFKNGAANGSGIDMVGCHDGVIINCLFENLDGNAIQAKGGSNNITISRNYFKNCGSRTLNLGGSTNLKYFRPMDATYEAANLSVYSNIIIGSDAPIAFVGCINSRVVNNTLVNPRNWVVRILQETVDPERFLRCSNNFFQNNIIYYGTIKTETNIGPNTQASTFTYSNNLWFNSANPKRQPYLPVKDKNIIVGKDPMFKSIANEDFHPEKDSPALNRARGFLEPVYDYYSFEYIEPRSIGAIAY